MLIRVRVESVRRKLLALAADSLILAGLCGLIAWAWGLSEGTLYQYVQRVQFARDVAEDGAGAEMRQATPAPPPRLDSAPSLTTEVRASRPLISNLPSLFTRDPQLIGELDAPEIGLSVMIRDGVDDATLRRAAGHLPSSALPGESGNLVLLGHRDTFFRPLRDIHRGNFLRIRTRGGQFTYVVESFEVTGPESVRFDSGSAPSATLVTCFPFTYIGPAPRRFVVHARLLDLEHSLGPRK